MSDDSNQPPGGKPAGPFPATRIMPQSEPEPVAFARTELQVQVTPPPQAAAPKRPAMPTPPGPHAWPDPNLAQPNLARPGAPQPGVPPQASFGAPPPAAATQPGPADFGGPGQTHGNFGRPGSYAQGTPPPQQEAFGAQGYPGAPPGPGGYGAPGHQGGYGGPPGGYPPGGYPPSSGGKRILWGQESVASGKGMAMLSYAGAFIGFPTAIIPLIQKDNEFALYHAKQAMASFIVTMIMVVLFFALYIVTCGLGIFAFPILFLPWITAIHGIILANNGEVKEPFGVFGLGEKFFGNIRPG